MGKQSKLLRQIIDDFTLMFDPDKVDNNYYQNLFTFRIKVNFSKSLNKSDLVRRILNDVVLSNDEIIKLLRIIYNK